MFLQSDARPGVDTAWGMSPTNGGEQFFICKKGQKIYAAEFEFTDDETHMGNLTGHMISHDIEAWMETCMEAGDLLYVNVTTSELNRISNAVANMYNYNMRWSIARA